MPWAEKGTRVWNTRERTRVAALFRHHVDSPTNRRAGRSCRIVRQPCWFCRREQIETTRIALAEDPTYVEPVLRLADFHHLDYARPFYGVWVCWTHHRRIDHGTLRVPLKATFDYASLIAPLLRPGQSGDRNGMALVNQERRALDRVVADAG